MRSRVKRGMCQSEAGLSESCMRCNGLRCCVTESSVNSIIGRIYNGV